MLSFPLLFPRPRPEVKEDRSRNARPRPEAEDEPELLASEASEIKTSRPEMWGHRGQQRVEESIFRGMESAAGAWGGRELEKEGEGMEEEEEDKDGILLLAS